MTKYIFLDFDGVLNTEFYQNLLISQGKPWGDENGAFFDPEAVMQLKHIVDATCADIIIESSWKYLGLKALREMWAARRLPGRLIDITPFTASDSCHRLRPCESPSRPRRRRSLRLDSKRDNVNL